MAVSVKVKDRPCSVCGLANKHYYIVMGRKLCRKCLVNETAAINKRNQKYIAPTVTIDKLGEEV